MMDKRGSATLSAGHGAVDLSQGAVPALLPFLIAARGMSLGSATALLTAATIGSSIVQPLFGLWADRLATPLLLPGGLALAGIGLGAVGWCDSYILLALALFVSAGSAWRRSTRRARGWPARRRATSAATGMSYFSVGGNLGFALGPLLAAPIVGLVGLHATPLLALPGVALAVVTARRLPALAAATGGGAARPRGGADGAPAPPPAAWWPFTRLVDRGGVADRGVLRAAGVHPGVGDPPPRRHDRRRRRDPRRDAGLRRARDADRRPLRGSLRPAQRAGHRDGAAGACCCWCCRTSGSSPFVVVVALVGLAVDGPFSTTVVLGQEYLPGRHGLASGVTLGLAIGLGGLVAAGLGALADATSLATTMAILPVFALLALASAVSLPEPERARRAALAPRWLARGLTQRREQARVARSCGPDRRGWGRRASAGGRPPFKPVGGSRRDEAARRIERRRPG